MHPAHRHHPRHLHGRRPMGPLGRYVRQSLRRRIFAWFFSGLFLTGLSVAVVMSVISRVEEPGWRTTMERGTAWFGGEFARDWDDAGARDAFARRTAEALSLNLELLDPNGQRLTLVGEVCRHHPIVVPVTRGGAALGTVNACFAAGSGPAMHWPLVVALGVLALWMASGRVARRLARPLDELGQVVHRIGEGDLSARAEHACTSPDEIGLVAEAVNTMAGRIEKQMKDQRELLATVSHELRTPLARVRVITELGRDGAVSPKTWDDLDREVVDMDRLVGELLASSRLDFGLSAVRRQPVRELVQRALERASVPLDKVQWHGEPGAVAGDPTLLQRALANLLENARLHAGGVDQVTVTVTGEAVRFEVLDRGPGLPEGGEAALFEKFQKGGSGLGLGLSLVRRIAEAHRGRAFASNRDGGGAVLGFEVWTQGAPPAEAPATPPPGK